GPAPAGLDARWQTESACVEAEILPDRVAALMGRAPPPAQLRLAAERQGDGWRIALELEPIGGPALRRTLEGRDCATLTAAVALVVAVQLDPVAVAGIVVEEPVPEPVPAEADVPPSPPRSPASVPAPPAGEPKAAEPDDDARREPEHADRLASDEPRDPPRRPRVL